RVTDTAINSVIVFPEAPLELQPDLDRGSVGHCVNGSVHFLAGIQIDLTENRQRNGTYAPVCRFSVLAAFALILVADRHLAIVLLDGSNLGIKRKQPLQLFTERSANLVHAADRLKHGLLKLVQIMNTHIVPNAGAHNISQLQGLGKLGLGIEATSRITLETADLGTGMTFHIGHVFIQRSPTTQSLQQLFLVLFGQGSIERLSIDGFGQKLGDLSLEIRMDMAKTLGLAIKMLFAMQVRVVVVLNKGFQLDLEPLAIVQQGPVMKGNTPRPRIDVLILVELHI